jgi:hypothetical protein
VRFRLSHHNSIPVVSTEAVDTGEQVDAGRFDPGAPGSTSVASSVA